MYVCVVLLRLTLHLTFPHTRKFNMKEPTTEKNTQKKCIPAQNECKKNTSDKKERKRALVHVHAICWLFQDVYFFSFALFFVSNILIWKLLTKNFLIQSQKSLVLTTLNKSLPISLSLSHTKRNMNSTDSVCQFKLVIKYKWVTCHTFFILKWKNDYQIGFIFGMSNASAAGTAAPIQIATTSRWKKHAFQWKNGMKITWRNLSPFYTLLYTYLFVYIYKGCEIYGIIRNHKIWFLLNRPIFSIPFPATNKLDIESEINWKQSTLKLNEMKRKKNC